MKKKLSLIFVVVCLSLIFSLGMVAVASSDFEKTDDIVVDENVYKGTIGTVSEGVLVWVDIENFDADKQYGLLVYEACEDKDFDIEAETNKFIDVEIEKDTFGYVLSGTDFTKEFEYGVKGYEKDGESYKLSKTTAWFRFTDTAATEFGIKLYGADVRVSSQAHVSDVNAVNKSNTMQYYYYAGDEFLGASGEYTDGSTGNAVNYSVFNVVDREFDENGNIEAKKYPITVKTMSGLTNSATSEAFEYEVVLIGNEDEFLDNVGTNEDLEYFINGGKYYVLTQDLEFSSDDWVADYVKEGIGQINMDHRKVAGYYLVRYVTDQIDGRGHKITATFNDGNTAEAKQKCVAGIFGKISTGAAVRNLVCDINIEYAGMQYTNTDASIRRDSGFCQILAGKLENSYIKLRSKTNSHIQRECVIGYPVNFVMKDVIFDYEVKQSDGTVYPGIDAGLKTDNKCSYAIWWESMCKNTLQNVVMISPNDEARHITGDANTTVSNSYRYKSMENLFTGTDGYLHTCRLYQIESQEVANGTKAYEVQTSPWSDFWTFDNAGIKLFDTVIYSAE